MSVEAVPIRFERSPGLANEMLNELFANAWPDHRARDFQPVLRASLAYIGAYQAERLVGFVNVVGDGGVHAFLLDTTVHRDYRRRGIGTELIVYGSRAARDVGASWLHADFESRHESCYRGAGFEHTAAGLLRLDDLRR